MEGQGWICISKMGNMRVMKAKGVYGVSKRDAKVLGLLKPGDDLFVFVRGDAHKVVGLCRVLSMMYESRMIDSYRWPFRVKVRFVWDSGRNSNNGIILPWRVGEEMSVEPDFSTRAIYKLTPTARSNLLREISGSPPARLSGPSPRVDTERGEPR